MGLAADVASVFGQTVKVDRTPLAAVDSDKGGGVFNVPSPSQHEEENRDSARAELEKELARKDLSPAARIILQQEHRRSFGSVEKPADGGLASIVTDAFISTPAESKTEQKKQDGITSIIAETAAPTEVGLNLVTGMASAVAGGWRGLAKIAAGGSLEEAAHAVTDTVEAGTYQPRSTIGKAITGTLESPMNPLNWPGMAANWAGEKVTDIGTKLGASPEAAAAAGAAVNTGLNAGAMAIPFLGKKGRPVEVAPAQTSEAAEAGKPRVKGPAAVSVESGESPQIATGKIRVKGPAATSVETSTPPKFAETPTVAPEGSTLAPAVQASRREVLKRVGVENARKSAIEGDSKAASTDYQTSKLDNAAGNFMRSTLDTEREALTNYANRLTRDTGGSIGVDGQALEARGHTILSPLEGFKNWFENQTNNLYKETRERAKDTPVELKSFQDILGTDSKFANTDTIELRKGIQARMKELGVIDEEGKVRPMTVQQAENLRQYIGEEWSPKSNGRIKELKNAIDSDVTQFAGEDLFRKARALHAMKESIFSDPKGISSILDSEGINRKVPIEKIADSITALPNAQFEHIVNTLRNVPPELKPQAQAALSEIKAQFLNRMTDTARSRAGQWGARDVSAYLNKNAAKLNRIFSKEEMAKINDLNEAGHILRVDSSYPGAAAQGHNLLRRGVMAGVRGSSAAGGALVGGPIGAVVGEAIGSKAAEKIGEAAALRSAQKRVVRLSEFPR